MTFNSPIHGSEHGEESPRLEVATELGMAVNGKTGKAVWALTELAEILPAPQAEQVKTFRDELARDLEKLFRSVPGLYQQIHPKDISTQ